jgi:hypothetical protein
MLARIRRTDDESSLNRFWLPAAFGSLAAAPVPGWAYTRYRQLYRSRPEKRQADVRAEDEP